MFSSLAKFTILPSYTCSSYAIWSSELLKNPKINTYYQKTNCPWNMYPSSLIIRGLDCKKWIGTSKVGSFGSPEPSSNPATGKLIFTNERLFLGTFRD